MNFEEGTAAAEGCAWTAANSSGCRRSSDGREFPTFPLCHRTRTVHVLQNTPPATDDVADYPPTVVREGNTSRGEWGNLGRGDLRTVRGTSPGVPRQWFYFRRFLLEVGTGGSGSGERDRRPISDGVGCRPASYRPTSQIPGVGCTPTRRSPRYLLRVQAEEILALAALNTRSPR